MRPLDGKIIITGGAGFVGSAAAWALNELGFTNILIVDTLGDDERWRNLVSLKFGDLVEPAYFVSKLSSTNFFGDCSAVLHFGGSVDTSERDATFLLNNNYLFTKTLAEWSIGTATRFLYASSAAVYGSGKYGMSDLHDSIGNLRPLNMYAYSKHLFDLYAMRQGWLSSIVGMRFFNLFGPNEFHKGSSASLISRCFTEAKTTGQIKIFQSCDLSYSDGAQSRDFLYIKDAAHIIVHFLVNGEIGGIYNIGSGETTSFRRIAELVFKAMGQDERIEYIPMPDKLKPSYQYYTRADVNKLLNSGYKQKARPIEEAIDDFVSNYAVPLSYLGE